MKPHSNIEKNTPSNSFSDTLKKKIQQSGTNLCVGIDPPLNNYGHFLEHERHRLGPKLFLEKFGLIMVESAAKTAPAVKVQSAYFEAYGAEGFAALETVMRGAKSLGLITILDAKRGDISSTMAAYGQMAFETMTADALTITPYMGLDVLYPLWPWLRKGKGVYVVWISSNPSGSLVQDAVATQLLEALHNVQKSEKCEKALGLVLGATKVGQLPDDLLEKAATLPLLMPGVGAQGGKITDQILNLKNQGCPILIPQSRSLMEQALLAENWESFRSIIESQIKNEARNLHN